MPLGWSPGCHLPTLRRPSTWRGFCAGSPHPALVVGTAAPPLPGRCQVPPPRRPRSPRRPSPCSSPDLHQSPLRSARLSTGAGDSSACPAASPPSARCRGGQTAAHRQGRSAWRLEAILGGSSTAVEWAPWKAVSFPYLEVAKKSWMPSGGLWKDLKRWEVELNDIQGLPLPAARFSADLHKTWLPQDGGALRAPGL